MKLLIFVIRKVCMSIKLLGSQMCAVLVIHFNLGALCTSPKRPIGSQMLSGIYVSDHWADLQDPRTYQCRWILDLCWFVIFFYGHLGTSKEPNGPKLCPGYIFETAGSMFIIRKPYKSPLAIDVHWPVQFPPGSQKLRRPKFCVGPSICRRTLGWFSRLLYIRGHMMTLNLGLSLPPLLTWYADSFVNSISLLKWQWSLLRLFVGYGQIMFMPVFVSLCSSGISVWHVVYNLVWVGSAVYTLFIT